MSKIRVYELAKELNITSKELITILMEEFSVEVKNHMSVIEEEDAALIKELFLDKEKAESKLEDEDIEDKYEELVTEDKSIVVKKIKKNNKKVNEKGEVQVDTEDIELEELVDNLLRSGCAFCQGGDQHE